MEWIFAKRISVERDLAVGTTATIAGNATVGGTLNVTGNTATSGTMAVNGDKLAVAKTVAIAPQTAISVTNGGIITPTGTLQMLTSGGTVTATLATGNSGDMLTLVNTSNTSIVVVDTTGQLFSGNVALGQWDTASFVFYGTSWIQTGESDN